MSYIELLIGTKIGNRERRNGFILRYYTEFGSFQGALRKSGSQSHNYGQFIRLQFTIIV